MISFRLMIKGKEIEGDFQQVLLPKLKSPNNVHTSF